MGRRILVLFLNVGLAGLFLVNAVSLLSGASMLTALARGVGALAVFAALGVVASLATRIKAEPPPE